MKMAVTSAQRTFTAALKTILPYNLFLLYLYSIGESSLKK